MVVWVHGLFMLIFAAVTVHCECDPNFKQIFFESAYKPGETKRSVTRVIPIRGCYMKEMIQNCIKNDEKLLNRHTVHDPGTWSEYAEAYVKCVLNTVYPENKAKDEQGKRKIYSYGEKLERIKSEDIILRAAYHDVKSMDLEDAVFDSNIVLLSKREGNQQGDNRGVTHRSSTSLIDTAEWENGFKYATRIESEVNIGLIKWSGGFDITGDDQAKGGNTRKNVTTVTDISVDFDVPTGKFVRTLWTAKRKKGYKKFTAKVMVSGWLWVNQEDQIRNVDSNHPYVANEYLFPVGDMAYYFDEFIRINAQNLFDNKRGTLSTTDIVHSVIYLDEFSKDSGCSIRQVKNSDMFTIQRKKK